MSNKEQVTVYKTLPVLHEIAGVYRNYDGLYSPRVTMDVDKVRELVSSRINIPGDVEALTHAIVQHLTIDLWNEDKRPNNQFCFSPSWVKEHLTRWYEDSLHHLETWYTENPSIPRIKEDHGVFLFTLRESDVLVEFGRVDGTLDIPLFEDDYENVLAGDAKSLCTLLKECALIGVNGNPVRAVRTRSWDEETIVNAVFSAMEEYNWSVSDLLGNTDDTLIFDQL